VPWLFDIKGNIPRAHMNFNDDLFFDPVFLAYIIAGHLYLVALGNDILETYDGEIAKDLLLCLR
jgi:hypothetical protein